MNFLITGGASGLGEAITRRLAQDPTCKVYFTYNNSVTNANKIETDFHNAVSIKCDFKNEGDINALKEKLDKLDLDVLVNNAYFGSFIQSYFHKIPVQNFLTEFKDNILPTIEITQVGINFFRKKKGGKIITILTSALVNNPPIGSSIYVANKAYMEELTKVWATENEKFNITSSSVSPSFMLTAFTKEIDERLIEQMKQNRPDKKLLTVEEVADTVFFLSNAAHQMNGVNIVL